MGIEENLNKIKEQIGNNKVKIIAVTKYAKWQQITEAYRLGIRDFGESYTKDAAEKLSLKSQFENLNDLIKWHFIGRLQKNKVKHVVDKFYLIHSVDSVELAELINKLANQKEIIQNILLQVNISQEAQKGGFCRDDLKSNFQKLLKLSNIKIQGLMAIALKTEDKKTIKDSFLSLYNLKNELNKEHKTNLQELSMGMSNDYLTAIECGSTMLRLGRVIFSE